MGDFSSMDWKIARWTFSVEVGRYCHFRRYCYIDVVLIRGNRCVDLKSFLVH